MRNFIFNLKERIRLIRGYYRIEPIDYKVIVKYGDIVARRRKWLNERDTARLMKAIDTFNREVEKVNY